MSARPFTMIFVPWSAHASPPIPDLEEAGTEIDTSMLNLEEGASDLEDTVLGQDGAGLSDLAMEEEGTGDDGEPAKLDLSLIEEFEEEPVGEPDAPSVIELGLLLDEPELERDAGEEGPAVELIGDLPAIDGGVELAEDEDLEWNKFADPGQIFSVTSIPFEPLPHRLELSARTVAALPEGGLLVQSVSGELAAFDQDLTPLPVNNPPANVERIYSAFGKAFVETETHFFTWRAGTFVEASPSDTGDLFSYPSSNAATPFASAAFFSSAPSPARTQTVTARTEWEHQYFSLVREEDGRMVVVRSVGASGQEGAPEESVAFELSPVFARATGIAFDAKRECLWIAGPFGLASFGRR